MPRQEIGLFASTRAAEWWRFRMSGLVRMSLDSPEETRPFEGGTGRSLGAAGIEELDKETMAKIDKLRPTE